MQFAAQIFHDPIFCDLTIYDPKCSAYNILNYFAGLHGQPVSFVMDRLIPAMQEAEPGQRESRHTFPSSRRNRDSRS